MKEILKKIYIDLINLKTKDKKSNIFIERNISELDKTCCTLQLKVFDFDKAKEEITKEMSLGSLKFAQPKSCDALKICYNTNKFDLIEMKSIKNFIKHYTKNKLNINEQINKYNEECKEKLKHSCEIINKVIIQNINMNLSTLEKNFFKKMPKNYYLLTDYTPKENPRESFAVNLIALSNPNNKFIPTDSEMMDKMKKIIGKDENWYLELNFNRPIVKSMKDLQEVYYKEFNENSAS